NFKYVWLVLACLPAGLVISFACCLDVPASSVAAVLAYLDSAARLAEHWRKRAEEARKQPTKLIPRAPQFPCPSYRSLTIDPARRTRKWPPFGGGPVITSLSEASRSRCRNGSLRQPAPRQHS